jgi:hypothetical protein
MLKKYGSSKLKHRDETLWTDMERKQSYPYLQQAAYIRIAA